MHAPTPASPPLRQRLARVLRRFLAPTPAAARPLAQASAYRDIGGLALEVERVREMVELPLRQPALFQHLGVEPPRGLLMYGPPGCGKTLIARAVARETEAVFFTVNGPEVVQKHYGESEELLRNVFEQAQSHPSAIIFFDEIDALAPHRDTVLGDVEKRIVAQLLALMDGVASRGRVIVMAATNLPNQLDPALRRPGRFDREIAIHPPSKAGRMEILQIHTRTMPLAEDVMLERIAAHAHGFLGADLAALCREAAMASARNWTSGSPDMSVQNPENLRVHQRHFEQALHGLQLSTLRELSEIPPETRWDQVAGLHAARQRLREALEWPQSHPARFTRVAAQAPRGILLTGPSGCGKTLLAQALGSNTALNFIVVQGPELLSKWVGDTERGIRELFRRARQAAPAVLFIDEIDAIAPPRGGNDSNASMVDRLVGQLLLELDRADPAAPVLVLAATNRPDRIDPALLRPGRFDAIITLALPDESERLAILKVHCAGCPLGIEVNLASLAHATPGLNGAELAALCQRAKLLAIAASIARQPVGEDLLFTVNQTHFLAAQVELASTRRVGQAPPPVAA
jgi:transitional endoplasmic reticulum ATPase